MPHRLGSRSGTLLADQQIGGPPNVEFGNRAAIGALRLGSLFLTLPTRALNGQHIIPPGELEREQRLNLPRVGRLLAELDRPALGRENYRRPVIQIRAQRVRRQVTIAKLRTSSLTR